MDNCPLGSLRQLQNPAMVAFTLLLVSAMNCTHSALGVEQIIAHRGSSADRPENTLASVRRAIEAGATAVEIDVRATKDGHLVILHDATLDRTTNGNGPLAQKTLAEVRALDAGSWYGAKYRDERIPTLQEVLMLCGDRIDILLDLKLQGESFAKAVAAEIQEHGELKRTIVGVRSVDQARLFRRLLPPAQQLGLIPNPNAIEAFAEAEVETIRLWPQWLEDDPRLTRRVRDAGARLHLNGTTGQPDEVRVLLKSKPDSLSADDPARLVKTLAELGVVSADRDSGNVRNGVRRIKLLPPGTDNPRNSEGDFVQLKGGRLLFVYTHFTGGAGDHAGAHLAGRLSNDGGQSWTTADHLVVPSPTDAKIMNIMSVSLLRLKDGRIALFYLRKRSLSDCRPVMRVSADEAKTWGEPVEIIPNSEVGYYVLNNDRVIQLNDGRLIVPLAQHHGDSFEKWTPHARILCYYSDNGGRSWRRGQAAPVPDKVGNKPVMLQEPGAVALKHDRLLLWCRTDAGSQYAAYSKDKGETWSKPQPTNMISPRSPATIERIPSTGDLLLIGNDHRDIAANLRGKRTPLCAAISSDEGKTWKNVKTLEDNPHGWYCYTAMEFVDRHVLLAHCAGDRRKNNGLALTQITRFPVSWLYQDRASGDQP